MLLGRNEIYYLCFPSIPVLILEVIVWPFKYFYTDSHVICTLEEVFVFLLVFYVISALLGWVHFHSVCTKFQQVCEDINQIHGPCLCLFLFENLAVSGFSCQQGFSLPLWCWCHLLPQMVVCGPPPKAATPGLWNITVTDLTMLLWGTQWKDFGTLGWKGLESSEFDQPLWDLGK